MKNRCSNAVGAALCGRPLTKGFPNSGAHRGASLRNSKGISVLFLIIAMLLMVTIGYVFSYLIPAKQKGVSLVIHSNQAFFLAQSGVEYAVRYASDQGWTMPASLLGLNALGPKNLGRGNFTITYDSGLNTLTSVGEVPNASKRKIVVSNFTSFLTASTGPKVITSALGGGGWNGAFVANLNSSNNVYAYTTQISFTDMTVFGFDFSAVPSGSIITGIEVKVEFSSSGSSQTATIHCALSWNGGTTYTAATADQAVTGTTDVTDTYGGSTNTWGRTWSVTELSTTNFRLKVSGKTSNAPNQCRVDYITVNVYYSPG